MKIEKVILYHKKFPIRLLSDAYELGLKVYESEKGFKLSDQLDKDGQKEPIIINVNSYSNGIRFDPGRDNTVVKKSPYPSYIKVEPGNTRLSAMRKLKWKHCKAITLTYDFMIPYLGKMGFLYQENISITRNDLRDYFSSLESPSFQWTEQFLNS
jgi:hypothetical protein